MFKDTSFAYFELSNELIMTYYFNKTICDKISSAYHGIEKTFLAAFSSFLQCIYRSITYNVQIKLFIETSRTIIVVSPKFSSNYCHNYGLVLRITLLHVLRKPKPTKKD